ncbi:hypothetical protein evm_005667 [Chilo suppressalis]|nr:hypothetical protein evm_005667 [Chilo suppressalis]
MFYKHSNLLLAFIVFIFICVNESFAFYTDTPTMSRGAVCENNYFTDPNVRNPLQSVLSWPAKFVESFTGIQL